MDIKKLNLGCGGNHKKDYLNVDAFDDTIADKIISATDLEFEDNTFDEILLSQVIEHLGIVQSLYTLSECFRVLKPQGKLIIETPDIRTSFKRYLNGNRETRKNILPWIYGVDAPGMLHRFCFPDDLLEEILKYNGFVEIKKEFLEFDELQPILKIVCKKPQNFQPYQIITHFRKNLLKKKLIELNDQIPTLEKEELIKIFITKTKEFLKTQKREILDEILIEGAIYSPEVAYTFFEEITNQKICSSKNVERQINVLKTLKKIHFSKILIKKLKKSSGFVGKQDKLFTEIQNFGRKTIKNLLNSSKELQKISLQKISLEKIDFFSEKIVMLRANQLFQKGVKEFNLSNYKMAMKYFKDSLGLYRDQILTYWNLGRLYLILNDKENSVLNYKNALSLTAVICYKNKTSIKRILEEEIKSQSLELIKEPLTSLNTLS